MPQTKQCFQRSAGKRRPQHGRLSNSNVYLSLLVEQAMDRLLEQEQLTVGLEEQ